METLLKSEIKQYIIDDWNNFIYKNDLAADIKLKYIFGPYSYNQHINIDDIWEIVQEVESGIIPPIIIIPPSDSDVLEKLISDNIVTQEVVNGIINELTPDPIIDNPTSSTSETIGTEHVEVGNQPVE